MFRCFKCYHLLLAVLCCVGMCERAFGEEWKFRLGPFFEYRSHNEEMSYFAIRPFYAWEAQQPEKRDADMDVLWPLSHFAWRDKGFQWRLLMTFWKDNDRENPDSDWFFTIPPLWVNGHDADKADTYWGLFPLYGRMPRLILVEDVKWILFPLYLNYRTGGSQGKERSYYLWPFISSKEDPDTTRWAFWPFYGIKRERGFDSQFVLWPLWNDYTYHAPNHNGTGWMLWPLMSRVDTDTEQGWGFLPPFFSYTKTTSGAERLLAPWPLFGRYTDPKESTWRFWRFYGHTRRGSRHSWYALWPLAQHNCQKTINVDKWYSHIWPFFTDEAVYQVDEAGNATLQSSYFRIWPFYSSRYNEWEGWRGRCFELFPFRDAPPIERNWSPFWTFYTATQKPNERKVLHELFWGLIWWHTDAAPYPEQHPLETEEDE